MYKDMTEVLSEKEQNGWKLEKFEVKNDDLLYAFRSGVDPGNYIRLMHNGKLVMSDTDMEKRTNAEFCSKAHGDVLIGGLGIGLIVLAIQDKTEVNSITILECNQDVIDLVATQLPLNNKVKIVNADVFIWKPDKGIRYDTIYMDIWPLISKEIYQKEMRVLKKKFARYLKSKDLSPNRFNKCWAEYYAKTERPLF